VRIKLAACISSATAAQLPIEYAMKKGLFAKHGLDVTITPIDSGSRAVAALVSGSVQVCQIASPAVVNGVAAGADLSIVGGLINSSVYSLMVAEDIRSAADLKGKAVAVSTAGSASAISMRMALMTLGLDPDHAVTILSVGGQAERMAALEAGYVVGTLADPPESVLTRERGYHALLDLSGMNLPYQHAGTVTTKAFVASNRAAVLGYVKAVSEAVFQLKKNREEALAELSSYLQLDPVKQAAALAETYDTLIKRKFSDVPYPTVAGVQTLIDEISAQNPDVKRLKAADLADLSIARELEESGFFRRLAEGK